MKDIRFKLLVIGILIELLEQSFHIVGREKRHQLVIDEAISFLEDIQQLKKKEK